MNNDRNLFRLISLMLFIEWHLFSYFESLVELCPIILYFNCFLGFFLPKGDEGRSRKAYFCLNPHNLGLKYALMYLNVVWVKCHFQLNSLINVVYRELI